MKLCYEHSDDHHFLFETTTGVYCWCGKRK